MAHFQPIQLADERYVMSSRTRMWILALITAGILLTVAGIIMHKNGGGSAAPAHDPHGHAMVSSSPEAAHAAAGHDDHAAGGHHELSWTARIWANLLVNSWFFFLISIIGVFFVAVNYLAQSGWYVAVKRVPEALGAYLPIALVTLLATLFFGGDELYHWMQPGITDPSQPNYDSIIAGKSGFLNKGFLYVGVPVIICIFILFNFLLRKRSLKEDAEGGTAHFMKSIRLSAGFTFIFAVSFSILTWLVIMSLDAHWFSTIFSVYNFATGFVSGVAVITLLVIFLQSQGYMSFVSKEHTDDLGKYMFAFSIFWTYIWVSQYLLIWYANIPEESVYYTPRVEGAYTYQFWTNLFLCFFFPFLWLITRNMKRKHINLVIGAIVILIGHWSDVFVMVAPAVLQETGHIGLLEIGMPLIFAGVYIFVVLTSLSKANIFPKNHPYLQESLVHETGP